MVGEASEPGGRPPAPGRLALVQAFLNSRDIEGGRERLADPDLLRRWLLERGLIEATAAVGQRELATAVRLREALRELAAANHRDGGEAGDAVRALNEISRTLPLHISFGSGDARLAPVALDGPGALGAILAAAYDALRAGTWSRLKTCRNDACRWVFYDRSKNRSGAWCTMSICGDRLKSRSYRARRAAS